MNTMNTNQDHSIFSHQCCPWSFHFLPSGMMPVLMIMFYATPDLYYFSNLLIQGIYTLLVLDEFRVPCRL
jgi:hypothetical protein